MEIEEGDICYYKVPGCTNNMYCIIITAEENKKNAFALELYLDFKIRHLRKGILIRNIPDFGKNIIVNLSYIHQINRDFIDDIFTPMPPEQFELISKKIKNKLLPVVIHDLNLLLEEYPG